MHSSRPFSRLPRVYLVFIVINVLLFVVQVARGVSAMSPASADMIAWGANVAALTLTGDAWRLLTIYDMCKAADRGMTMTGVRVLEKHGGKSGSWQVS